jgi:hypothetical protein
LALSLLLLPICLDRAQLILHLVQSPIELVFLLLASTLQVFVRPPRSRLTVGLLTLRLLLLWWLLEGLGL